MGLDKDSAGYQNKEACQLAHPLLTREEANRLIDCMPESIKTVVIFALATGLRLSNILDLEWTQVDMQRKVAWINSENAKAGKAIGVALNDTTCKVLKGQIDKQSR